MSSESEIKVASTTAASSSSSSSSSVAAATVAPVAVYSPRPRLVGANCGNMFALAVKGGTVILIDTTVPNSLCATIGDDLSGFHTRGVSSVQFSTNNDDRYIVTTSEDGLVALWDKQRSKRIRLFLDPQQQQQQQQQLTSATTSSASSAGSQPQQTSTSSATAASQGLHQGSVYRAVFNESATLVATVGEDFTAILWDISPTASRVGEIRHVFRGHEGRVLCCALSGNTLATCSEDHAVCLWDAVAGNIIFVLEGHTAVVFAVAFSPDVKGSSRVLASCSEDGSIIIWDVSLIVAEMITKYPPNPSDSNSSSSTTSSGPSNAQIILAASQSPSQSGGSLQPPRKRAVLYAHNGCVFNLAFSKDGKFLATCGEDMLIIVWDTRSWQRIANLQQEGHTAPVSCVAFHPLNSNLLASGSDDELVMLWDVTNRKRLQILEGHSGVVNSLHFNSKGTVLGAACGNGNCLLWDLAPGKLAATIPGHVDDCLCMSFSPSRKLLATGGKDRKIFVFDLNTWKKVACLEKHVGAVTCLLFSPDASLLASASDDTTVVLWDTFGPNAWQKKFTNSLRNHEYPVTKIEFAEEVVEDYSSSSSSSSSSGGGGISGEKKRGVKFTGSIREKILVLRTIDSSGILTVWNTLNADIIYTGPLKNSSSGSGSPTSGSASGSSPVTATSSSSGLLFTGADSIMEEGGMRSNSSSHNHHHYYHDPTSASGELGMTTSPSSSVSVSASGGGGGGVMILDPYKKLEVEFERGHRSYVEEEKTSRMFLLQSRAHDVAKVANNFARHVTELDKKDRLRDTVCSRLLLLEKQELLQEHELEQTNHLLASEVTLLRDKNHHLERSLAALTGNAKKLSHKQPVGQSIEVQTFSTTVFNKKDFSPLALQLSDSTWLQLSADEPFRFSADSVAFRVHSVNSSGCFSNESGEEEELKITYSPTSSSSFTMNNLGLIVPFGSLMKLKQQQQQQEGTVPTISMKHCAFECFCCVDIPKFIREKCANGGLAGRPMHGASLRAFDVFKLNQSYHQQVSNWITYCEQSYTSSQRWSLVESARAIFASQKGASWMVQSIKRNHFVTPTRKPINFMTCFAPCTKAALAEMSISPIEGGMSLLQPVCSEQYRCFKNFFDASCFPKGNLVDGKTAGLHATLSFPSGLLCSPCIERSLARSVAMSTKIQAAASSQQKEPSLTSWSQIHNRATSASSASTSSSSSPSTTSSASGGGMTPESEQQQSTSGGETTRTLTNYLKRSDIFPVLLLSVATTTVIPAFLPNPEAKVHLADEAGGGSGSSSSGSRSNVSASATVAEFSTIQGSSTVLATATRRASFEKMYLDSGNCDYLELLCPRGSVVVPLGVLWLVTTEEFRQDVKSCL